jgi:hypothetical protein
MNGRQWKDGETAAHFLYYDETGRIVGEVNRAGHQINTKHTTTVYPNASQTLSLGMEIILSFRYSCSIKVLSCINQYFSTAALAVSELIYMPNESV